MSTLLAALFLQAVEPPAAVGQSAPPGVPLMTEAQRELWGRRLQLRPGEAGRVELRCRAGDLGSLVDCEVTAENPEGEGFGAAALQIMRSREAIRHVSDTVPVGAPVAFMMPFRLED